MYKSIFFRSGCYLIALMSFSNIFATTYYLAPNGSDTQNGSVNSPWKTLSHANSAMSGQDDLLVKGGSYTGQSSLKWTKSGTAQKPLTIKAMPNEKPAFNGNGASWLLSMGCKYVILDGLEVTNYNSWAIMPDGFNDITIRNCYFHNVNAVMNGVITPKNGFNILVENCVFEENGGALDQMAYNHCFYMATGSHDAIVRNNLFKNNHGGPVFNHYHTPSPYNTLIYNNVFYMTTGAERSGVFNGDGSSGIKVFNNTFYIDGKGATKCYGIFFNSGNGTNSALNNIFYFDNWPISDAIMNNKGDTYDYNLYYPSLDSDDRGAHSFAADPLFVNKLQINFRLNAGSPAIDKGSEISLFTIDFSGASRTPTKPYDIGAFEYTSSVKNRDNYVPRNGTGSTRAGIRSISVLNGASFSTSVYESRNQAWLIDARGRLIYNHSMSLNGNRKMRTTASGVFFSYGNLFRSDKQ